MSKVESLVNGLNKLVHSGELNKAGLITLGPKLGFRRRFYNHGIYYDEYKESNTAYLMRITKALSDTESLARFGQHYENLSVHERRAIGRAIKKIRRKRSKFVYLLQ